MADAQQKTRQYEAMFLLGPVGTAEPERAIDLCRKTIESHGGQIILIKKWDERKLMYEVNGQKRGTYVIAYFRAPGSTIAPLERDVKLSEEILRVMVTEADHLSEKEMAAVEPQPIVREEPRGFDREGGFGGDRGGFRGGDRGDRGGGFGADRGDRGDRGGFGGDRGPRPPREEAPAGRE
jgi:small subunit ribosomal protein S6